MLALLINPVFPFGPLSGPIEPSPLRTRQPWRTFIATSPSFSVKTYDLLQGILLENGDLTLLDPITGRVRWHVPFVREGKIESVTGAREIEISLEKGTVVRLDPETGRALGKASVTSAEFRALNPYVFPVSQAFRWNEGWGLSYGRNEASVDDEDGPVGVAFVHGDKYDDWHGAFLATVVRGPMGTAIGDLQGHGGDGPERRIYSRAICADAEGVWVLRRSLETVGNLSHVSPLGFEKFGPELEPTLGLPAWTRSGIVYAKEGVVYRFDGKASHRLLSFALRKVDGCEPWTANLTRWGLVRTGSFQKGATAWTVVRLYPFPWKRSDGPSVESSRKGSGTLLPFSSSL